MADQNTILEGSYVIFKTEDKCKVHQISSTRDIYFEKTKLKGKEIVGHKYGTQFEVQQGKLVSVTSSQKSANESSTFADGAGKDNRDLVASGENQKLSQQDIMKMKEEGLSGQDIVGKLVEQSETFKTKTEFSQEKYIKKKTKKHTLVFRVLRPNCSLLLDTFKYSQHKICNLRADSMSQLLAYSNVMTGSTVAVVESCQGLVLGSVMARMGGVGKVIHLYPGNDMNRFMVKQFNFPEDHIKTLYEFPLKKLSALENGTLLSTSASDKSSQGAGNSETCVLDNKKDCVSEQTMEVEQQCGDTESKEDGVGVKSDRDDCEVDNGDEGEREDKVGNGVKPPRKRGRKSGVKKGIELTQEERAAKKEFRAERLKESATILQEKSLDSLIIATKHDPVSLLLRLLPYVAPSRPVVVFCQHKEPLVECFSRVKENSYGIQLKLSESWYREYQVLPSRTHPMMNMSGTGGYLLSFIRVSSQR